MDRMTRSRRRFDRLWRVLDEPIDDSISDAKDEILNDLPRNIVEIGPGHGSNFPRYPKGSQVVAFEPNEFMHATLVEKADAAGISLDLRSDPVEEIDLENETADAVVSSLVLCSVHDQGRALEQIRRVLRPGGRFFFIEHVAAAPGTWRARFQKLLRRPWRSVADQCDLLSRADEEIRHAGFSDLDVTTAEFGAKLDPSAVTFYGVATK